MSALMWKIIQNIVNLYFCVIFDEKNKPNCKY